jgi:hypothetical protein
VNPGGDGWFRHGLVKSNGFLEGVQISLAIGTFPEVGLDLPATGGVEILVQIVANVEICPVALHGNPSV